MILCPNPHHRTDFLKLECLARVVGVLFCPNTNSEYSPEFLGRTAEFCDKPALTIDTLPDNVLLGIFSFCVSCPSDSPGRRMREWRSLVQVCKRWQETIYASPRYLDLSLYFSNGDTITETLDRWPELPLILSYVVPGELECPVRKSDLYELLAQRDRICRIELVMTPLGADWVAEPMAEQFPLLTHLDLISEPKLDPDDPDFAAYFPYLDQFLGGSAPSLQHLCIDNVDYEGLPSLLSSAPNLVSLQIKNIRPTCYLPPKEMVGALSGLTKLRDLCIELSTWYPTSEFRDVERYQTPPSSSPSLVHVIFPALTQLQIRGDSQYLEDLVALIDAPLLEDLSIEYPEPDEPVEEGGMKADKLSQFIGRTETFKHAGFRRTELTLDRHRACVKFDLPHGECQQARLSLTVLDSNEARGTPFACTAIDMILVLSYIAIMPSEVRHLSIKDTGPEDQENQTHVPVVTALPSVILGVRWFPIFLSFPAVHVIHVTRSLAEDISCALRDTPSELVARVLPALQVIWLDVHDTSRRHKRKLMGITRRFLSLRDQSGLPVAIVYSRNEFVERLNPQQMELSGISRVRLDTPRF